MSAWQKNGGDKSCPQWLRWDAGQRLDRWQLDLQLPDYERSLANAPDCHSVLATSRDVLLTFSQNLPVFPGVDILGLGIWVRAETASVRAAGFFRIRPADHPQLG